MRTYPKALLALTTALLSSGIAFTTPASAVTPSTIAGECTPGTYTVTADGKGWYVCNADSRWVHGGDCPPGTVAKFFPQALSPYCVPPDWQPPGQ